MSTATPTKPNLAPHEEAMNKAKIALMSKLDSAFFSHLCFSLKHVWDESCETAYTDGLTIHYNPSLYISLPKEEQVGLMLHETMHVAYDHLGRMWEGIDHGRANVAMDHVIDLQLLDAGFRIPAWMCQDPQYANMTWEAVYKLLPPGCKPRMLDVRPGTGPQSPGDRLALTKDLDDILVRAATFSKMAGDKPGTIPGQVQLYLDSLLNPKLPWNRILMKYLRQFDKSDYSWRKFSRRFFPKHYIPSLHGQKLMNLAIAVDISGSVSDHDFKVFVSEVASIFRMMKPDQITLLQFDTEIHHVDKVKNINELTSIKFTGRGGTWVHPVLDWAAEEKPQLLLIFSDGEFQMPTEAPKGSEVLWLIHNNPKFDPPFGKVIHYHI